MLLEMGSRISHRWMRSYCGKHRDLFIKKEDKYKRGR